MRQVLFWIPTDWCPDWLYLGRWFPDGVPVYAYGAMLFVAFIVCVWFTHRLALKRGYSLPREKLQDMGILLFVVGLAGARLTYMWQFNVPWQKFFRIWEGGIVLYGGIIGGAIAFILFHRFVLRKFNVTLWQMGDLAAPGVALGIAIGRVGCLLNGCCWGNPAPFDAPSVEFPLFTAPAREMLVDRDAFQTAAGFRIARAPDGVRSAVGPIEPDSAAAKAGLREGDVITRLKITNDWQANGEVLIFSGRPEAIAKAREALSPIGKITELEPAIAGEATLRVVVDNPADFLPAYRAAINAASAGSALQNDLFRDTLGNWPRGRNSVGLEVERQSERVELPPFAPLTIGLHPTQTYETISMILILIVVLAYYPFRRHDGQVWVLFMILYAIHRFLNEILRTEPVEWGRLTLSQGISIGVVVVAIGLEIYLRQNLPKRTASA
jgi:prolipoprotein diacylglyceryltransferase